MTRPPRPGRSVELDGLRTIAIVAMILSHVTRTIRSSVRSDWCELALLLDPYIQALFLGLVGASLAWSWGNAAACGVRRATWLRGRARRAAEVYLVGVVLFLFDKGAQWPYVLIAPGILADIAAAIVLYGLLASSRRPVTWALLASAAGYAVAAGLEQRGLHLVPLNAANAPLLPNVAVTGIGLAAATLLLRQDRRGLAAMATAALLGAAWALTRHGPAALLDAPVGRTENVVTYLGDSHGMANTWAMLTGGPLPPDEVEYFNPSVAGQPFVLGAVAATWLLLRALRPVLARVEGWLFLVGRHSLTIYVVHLFLVGIPTVIQGRAKPWRQGWTGDLWALSVVLACYALAWALERRQRGRRARAAAR